MIRLGIIMLVKNKGKNILTFKFLKIQFLQKDSIKFQSNKIIKLLLKMF